MYPNKFLHQCLNFLGPFEIWLKFDPTLGALLPPTTRNCITTPPVDGLKLERRGYDFHSQKLSFSYARTSKGGPVFPKNLLQGKIFRPKFPTYPLNFSKR